MKGLISFILFFSISGHAFVLFRGNPRVVDGQLDMRIITSGFTSLTSDQALAAAKASGKTWSSVSESKLEIKVSGTTTDTSDKFVIFVNPGYGFSSSEVAVTEVSSSGGSGISSSRIYFNPNFTMRSDASLPATSSGSTFDFQMILTHEMGHAVGLNHSTVTTAVMASPAGRANIRTLVKDDYWAVAFSYPRKETFPSFGCGAMDTPVSPRGQWPWISLGFGLPLFLVWFLKKWRSFRRV